VYSVTEYARRSPIELDRAGGHYSRHVAAMTAEGLHSKSDIAAELAWRDMRKGNIIDALRRAERRELEALAELDELRANDAVWESRYVELADVLGLVNRPEGQGGYEVASHESVLEGLRECVAARNREFEAMPAVCPGCHAVASERCLPGCIDAEIEDAHRDAIENGNYESSRDWDEVG
jgi:hypothetical protein